MTPEIRRLLDEPPSHIIDLAVEVSVWSPCRSKREAPKEEDLSRVAPPVVAQAHGDLPRSPPRDGSQR
jgi:hypothetical protein